MKRVKRVLGVLLFIYAMIALMLYTFQEKLIFQSSTLPETYEYEYRTPYDELFLNAEDGAVLNGLHFKRENPNGVILYSHGNARDLSHWGDWAQLLSERFNYDVVIWDYRGYGKSTGKRKPTAMLDDGMLFYKYCQTLFGEDEIVVFGRSLGGAFASHIASQTNPSKLILESTFTSIGDVAAQRYWFLPVRTLLKFKFQNIRNVGKVTYPTYFIHGTEDNVIDYDFGKALYEASASEDKKFFTVEGGYHNDLPAYPEYFEALDEILR